MIWSSFCLSKDFSEFFINDTKDFISGISQAHALAKKIENNIVDVRKFIQKNFLLEIKNNDGLKKYLNECYESFDGELIKQGRLRNMQRRGGLPAKSILIENLSRVIGLQSGKFV